MIVTKFVILTKDFTAKQSIRGSQGESVLKMFATHLYFFSSPKCLKLAASLGWFVHVSQAADDSSSCLYKAALQLTVTHDFRN